MTLKASCIVRSRHDPNQERNRDSYRQAPLRKVPRQVCYPCNSHEVWQYNTIGGDLILLSLYWEK